jgi:3-hydroxypropanoate dehydrogenase
MQVTITKVSLGELFIEARIPHEWQQIDVSDELLHQVFNLAKWAPTARFLFVKSKEAKEKLIPALSPSSVPQVVKAPVTVVVAYDEKLHEDLQILLPAYDAQALLEGRPKLSQETAFRNGSLQGAYLILAARALGLDVGPMYGFDNAKVDQAFFQGTSWKSNFLCNIGYGDAEKLFPRGRRHDFEQVSKII